MTELGADHEEIALPEFTQGFAYDMASAARQDEEYFHFRMAVIRLSPGFEDLHEFESTVGIIRRSPVGEARKARVR